MKIIYQFISLAVMAIIFNACVKKVTIDLPYEGDKIVVKSIIKQDSNIYALISKSTRPNANSFNNQNEITNASITVLENNVPVTSLTLLPQGQTFYSNNRWYISNYKAKAGKTYTLKITVPNLPNAEGTETMISKPKYKIESYYKIVNSTLDTTNVVKLNLTDLPTEDYYQIKMYTADTNFAAIGPRYIIDYNSYVYFSVNSLDENASIFDQIDGGLRYSNFYFSDKKFNGKIINPKFEFNNYSYGTNRIAVILESISKNYYRFLVSAENHLNNSGNPFSEPTQVYTNITNGYGIIGTSADSILFKKVQ
jgi:Domain of unknown function (DUF4249)